MAKIPDPKTVLSKPIESDEIQVQDNGLPAELDNDAALRLVLQDNDTCDNFINGKTWNWSYNWREAEVLYQSPRSVSAWEGSTVTKSNVSRFTVAKHVNSIVPQLKNALFSDTPPFVCRPRPGTDEDVTTAWQTIHATLLDMMGFEAQAVRFFQNDVLFGTGIAKWGWLYEEITEKRYVRKGDPLTVDVGMGQSLTVPTKKSEEYELREIPKTICRTFFDTLDHRRVKVDPSTTVGDIREAKYVIYEDYLTFWDLEKLRDDDNYTLPDEETLKGYFFTPKEQPKPPSWQYSQASTPALIRPEAPYIPTTADPLDTPLQVLERVDRQGRVITVLNQKEVIRNSQNDLGQKINYFSSNWWDIPNTFWGIGVGRIVGQDQRVDTGVTNAALDLLSQKVNWTALRNRGTNAPTQPIRLKMGGIYDVDGPPKDAFAILETPNVPAEVWVALQASQAAAESATGANELLVQGSLPATGRTSMGRTATGAGNMQAASSARLQGPLDRFIDQVFIPFLYEQDQIVRDRMPIQQIKDILGDRLGQDFAQKLDYDQFMNARMDYEVLAGAKLAAKRSMMQALPLMFNLFGMPAVTEDLRTRNKKIVWERLVKRLEMMSEWNDPSSIIEDMTPEEVQAMQQNNPAVQAAQAKQQANDQQFQQKQQLQENDQIGRAGNQLLRIAAEKMMNEAAGGLKDEVQ